MPRELSRLQLIERSITKKYRKELWSPFITAIRQYELLSPRGPGGRLHLRREGLHADGEALSDAPKGQRLPL